MAAKWQEPALTRLGRAVSSEKTTYWLLVVVTALTAWPLGYWLAVLLFLLLPPLDTWAGEALSGILEPVIPSAVNPFLSAVGRLLAITAGLAVPLVAILWALATYNRFLRVATYDLVWGQGALVLIDDQFAQLVEEKRRERYWSAVIAVPLGTDFLSRLHHYAAYYGVFHRLSTTPREFRVPAVHDRNCWLEGSLACLGGCLNTCLGAGLLLTIPLLARVCATWPQQLAVKQAVFNYLSGMHDADLERQYSARQAKQP